MVPEKSSRRSHCAVCGTRLSVKTPAGKIKWQPSRVDDKGIYCVSCTASQKGAKEHARDRKGSRS